MTDKQIIKLKPTEDLNEKIIKEKGNTKCIFYADDICRNGDKTRDCINCARVEYRSLYKLNWDNQTRLNEEIYQLKKENEKLKKKLEQEKDLNKEMRVLYEKFNGNSLIAKSAKRKLINLQSFFSKTTSCPFITV